jgi:hypothetical protein
MLTNTPPAQCQLSRLYGSDDDTVCYFSVFSASCLTDLVNSGIVWCYV